MRAFGLLKAGGVFVNLLCVLHKGNVAEPEAVYGFFKEIGAKYLQFSAPGPAAGKRSPPLEPQPRALKR